MNKTKRLTYAALFMALGLVLPFLTGQIPQVGSMLLPMHIPVLICGFICGGQYGFIVGFIVPIFRSICFGMPPMMPTAVSMAFELGAYGLLAGILYKRMRGKKGGILISLLGSMIGGRIVWGMVSILLYQMMGNVFTWGVFTAGAVLNAIPGIALQVVFIPAVIYALEKSGVSL